MQMLQQLLVAAVERVLAQTEWGCGGEEEED